MSASRIGFVVTFALAMVAACADDPSVAPVPTPEEGGVLPVTDANAPETADAADAADVIVPPRTCSDDGWCHVPLPSANVLRGVWADGAGTTWAVSREGNILRFDAGAWKVHATVTGPLYAVWGSGPLDVWIGGAVGILHGSGASASALVFEPGPTPGNATVPITSIWGSGPSDVWAVGGVFDGVAATTRVLHYTGASTDAGATWAVDAVGNSGYAFTKVWGTAASGAWIGGVKSDGFGTPLAGLYRRPALAASFAAITTLPIDPVDGPEGGQYGVEFSAGGFSGTDVWIAAKSRGFSPGFWRGTSTDGKTFAFSHVARDLNDQRIEAIAGTAPDSTWAIGDYGRLRHWDGTTWKQSAVMVGKLPVIAPLWGMWVTSASDIWVVGDDIALHFDPTMRKK